MRKILVLLTLALIAVTSFMLVLTGDRTRQGEALPEDKTQGEALIGGDFTLTDTTGKSVSDADFRGRVMLVFFGFTHCPDICPVTLGTMSKMVGQLDEATAAKLAPVFITVDPERDTADVMKGFLANFDKRIIGLTGTPEQVKQAASAYRAYYAKNVAPGSNDNNYMVDHSGFIYLMGKDGKFLKAIPYNVAEADLTGLVVPYLQ